jgi:UDPglucose 6-dehydrogenase
MSSNTTTFTILGAGYVGLTTAALLAHAGYTIYALEPNPERLKAIKQGRSFFYEEGLDPVIKAAIDAGTLIPTDSYEESIPKSNMVFSCVGTPDNGDGSSNLTYVLDAAKSTAAQLTTSIIYIQKSTVPVGTGKKVQAIFSEAGKTVRYVSNPEFLREGTALTDTLYFDRVVAGGENTDAVQRVLDVYRQLEQHREKIARLASIPLKHHTGHYIATALASAELIKVSSNAFLALKISFANSIAKLADQVDADVVEVMDAVGADKRIGRAFLNTGRGYGGGCFPKDVSGLIASGLEYGVNLEIMTAAQRLNDSMPGYIVEKTKRIIGSLTGKKIAVLGLAFKAGTSDVRRSPGIQIANHLQQEGAKVIVYDPKANHEAEAHLDDSIRIRPSLASAIDNVDVIFITTDWEELITKPVRDYAARMNGDTFVDAINHFDPSLFTKHGLTYIGVGHNHKQ